MLVVLLLSAFLGAAGQVVTRTSTSVTIIVVSTIITSTGAITEPIQYGGFATFPPCVQATAIPALETALSCTKNWPCVCSADYSDALSSLVSVACTQLPDFYKVGVADAANEVFSDFCFQLLVTVTSNYTSSSTTKIEYSITSVPTSGTALFCGTNF